MQSLRTRRIKLENNSQSGGITYQQQKLELKKHTRRRTNDRRCIDCLRYYCCCCNVLSGNYKTETLNEMHIDTDQMIENELL